MLTMNVFRSTLNLPEHKGSMEMYKEPSVDDDIYTLEAVTRQYLVCQPVTDTSCLCNKRE